MAKPQEDRDFNVPDELIKELMTDSELRMVQQRFMIANMLEQGQTIRSIAENVGVGTDTVVRTARLLEKRQLNDRMKKLDQKTPWVFGKSER